ncbi:hypothetical protein HGI47_21095 [Novosphingobium sp. ERN07]|uniref:HNH endonuclease n=1 Tax=Novosphingobium sp. ERN07 TaxID=2726187 RepID=UPI001457057D|nr:hypothetical protein [Novosphingobium sp. ERN07]NLR73370.1 hypothetical protein [Novosphingobium sp. ERN07]
MAIEFIAGDINKPDWILDPETDEYLPIERGQAWLDAMNEFHATQCKHEHFEALKVRIADGRPQVYKCCTNCGERSGTAMSQKDREWVDSLSWLPDELIENYRSRREREKHAVLLGLAREQFAERGRFTTAYRAYLASHEWKSLREKVMRRCNRICEGCGDSPATEVHHLTYRHFMNEFLFELVGLCEACHVRWHDSDKSNNSKN